MNKVKITIAGAGGTFGTITKAVELLLLELGAKVELQLDHPTAIMSVEEAKPMAAQLKGREITIETISEPWGG